MKKISEITNVMQITAAREQKTKNASCDAICVQLVDQIFVKFNILFREYDTVYKDKEREKLEKRQWAIAFDKNGIRTRRQIQAALDKTELYKYPKPPQLGQFLDWCLNIDLISSNFPKINDAYLLSIKFNSQYSQYHCMCCETICICTRDAKNTFFVINYAIEQIGKSQYRKMTEINSRKTFEKYYSIAVNNFNAGKLDVINKMLDDDSIDNLELEKRTRLINPIFSKITRESAINVMRSLLN